MPVLIAAHEYVLQALIAQIARRTFFVLWRGLIALMLMALGALAGLGIAVATVLVFYSVIDCIVQSCFSTGF